METKPACSVCGTALPADAPRGLCPQCLVRRGLEESATVSESAADEAPAGPGRSSLARLRYFGDYELEEEIARGGMGVVYKARQCSLNRVVAVKMILAGRLAGEGDVRRFLTEAEAAANLQHPNIVAIHEIGEHDGQHYFSMDFVEGKNLADVARQGRMPAERAARLVKTVAEAIHYAHQRGILHRDLKPHNVIIGSNGEPRVTDFGLAKRLEGGSELTRTGAVLGSPSYMAPEQAGGRQDQAGPPSDVYSLGAILYELLTGRAPFQGATPAATLMAVMNEPVTPPAKLHAGVPKDLETICLKCLEKQPERRYATARALAEELGRFLNREPILARPAGVPRRMWSWTQRHPWVLAGAAAVLLLGLSGLALGLWEQTRFMAWKMTHSAEPLRARPGLVLTTCWLGMFTLLWLTGFAAPTFAAHYRRLRETGRRVGPRVLLGYGSLGIVALVYAAVVVVKAIHVLVWEQDPGVLPVTYGVAAVVWSGLLILWQAVGSHESSVYVGVVERSFARQLAKRSRTAWLVDPGARVRMRFVFGFLFYLSMVCGATIFLGASEAQGVGRVYWVMAGVLSWLAAFIWALRFASVRGWKRPALGLGGVLAIVGAVWLAESWRRDTGGCIAVGALSGVFAAAGYWLHRLGKRLSEMPKAAEAADDGGTVAPPPVMGRGYVVGLVVWGLLCLGLAVDSVVALRARVAAQRMREAAADRGVHVDWAGLVTPPVADHLNFAKTPVLQAVCYVDRVESGTWARLNAVPLGASFRAGDATRGERLDLERFADLATGESAPTNDGALRQGDTRARAAGAVLARLAAVEPELAQLRQARERPLGFLEAASPVLQQPTPNKAGFQLLANLLVVHGVASLAAGRSQDAQEDLETLLRLADVLDQNQALGGASLRAWTWEQGLQTVWEGLADHRWSDAQLAAISRSYQAVDLLRGFDQAFQREFVAFNAWYDQVFGFFRFVPFYEVISRRERVWNADLEQFLRFRDTAYDVGRRQVFPAATTTMSRLHMFDFWSADPVRRLVVATRAQAYADLTVTACALERYRLATGDYPASLAALAPRFLATLPHDVTTGQPLHYRRSDATFVLYSAGWDQIDDGGVDPSGDARQLRGDWVWHAKAAPAN
jgi:tRNA A-37 threonylcarbamoyl transferase component Bud32